MSNLVLTTEKKSDIIQNVQKGQTVPRKGAEKDNESKVHKEKQLNSRKLRYVLLKKSQSTSAPSATNTDVQNRVLANPEARRL